MSEVNVISYWNEGAGYSHEAWKSVHRSWCKSTNMYSISEMLKRSKEIFGKRILDESSEGNWRVQHFYEANGKILYGFYCDCEKYNYFKILDHTIFYNYRPYSVILAEIEELLKTHGPALTELLTIPYVL